ncbi:inositol monophosphatase family protein [Olivibacter sp. 47]|uniref:inositol monophosphatase family protein n=1 Tax=Olivibacter sp. 47 TaxID=3056486 RepID=UPI0025A42A84|nr:inositol monophosphatase family protein [Olivibacter sp. 47]MDM8175362.1 inositol monophosphatase family protein [Olivibacter sp. 47]
MLNLSQLTQQVRSIAIEAANFIRQERLSFDKSKIEQKGLHDLVSYVDKGAEFIIVERLKDLLPEAGFISEEKTIVKKGDVYNWIIDPLDGTTNFIHDIPAYCVSIALARNRQPIIGVVYEVTSKECYYAFEQGGAFLNDRRIKVSASTTLSDSLLATGFPFYKFEYQNQYINLLKHLMQQCRGIRRIGSAALDLAYAAAGRFDCFFEYNLNDYDMAAGVLLVKEAGGIAYDFEGSQEMLDKRSVIAGNFDITNLVLSAVKMHFK